MFNAGLWTQLDIDMKCDLDWEEWERFSRLEGSCLFTRVLFHHRIHEGSETTALIEDDTRSNEDLEMLNKSGLRL